MPFRRSPKLSYSPTEEAQDNTSGRASSTVGEPRDESLDVLEGDLEGRGVAVAFADNGRQEQRAAPAKDPVSGVALVAPALRRVGLSGVDLVGERVVEIELGGEVETRRRRWGGPDLEMRVDR